MAKKRGKMKAKKIRLPNISRKKAIAKQKRHARRQRKSFLNRFKSWELAELLGIMFGIIIGAVLTTISILPYPAGTYAILKIIGFILMLPLVIPYSIIIMVPYCTGGCLTIYFIMGILTYAFIGALSGPIIAGYIEKRRKRYGIK